MPPNAPTLLEDWKHRRLVLLKAASATDNVMASAQIRVLNYLVKRYAGQPIGIQTARFPASGTLFLSQRLIVIHHHLQSGISGKIETKTQAHIKASGILHKIKKHAFQSEQSTTKPATPILDRLATSLGRARNIARDFMDFDARRPFESILQTTPQIQRMDMVRCFDALHPDFRESGQLVSLQYIEDKLMDLRRMRHPDVPGYVMLAWRENLVRMHRTEVVVLLENFLRDETYLSQAVELFRAELGNANHLIRSRALEVLAQVGSLQDIGLIADLLNLPPQSDEYAGEREALLSTLLKLSGEPDCISQAIAEPKTI